MKRTRRNHSPTFKAKIALQAIRGDKTLAELAQQHQVHATQIGAWKQQLLEHAAELFANGQRPGGHPGPPQPQGAGVAHLEHADH